LNNNNNVVVFFFFFSHLAGLAGAFLVRSKLHVRDDDGTGSGSRRDLGL
jgi:hypothetical protein